MRRKKWWIIIPLILVLIYILGPNPDTPKFEGQLPAVPSSPAELQSFVSSHELAHKIKPDNEARIVWANDSSKQQTEYSILYLHGFSASQAEGDPIHRNIAKKFGCNLYLSRLAEHGIDTLDPLINMTADNLWQSAQEAYAIAARLGRKVIVMGTSTGGTLALMLAERHPEIHSLILLSPNIRIFDNNAWLINNPWGLQLARAITQSDYVYSEDTRAEYKKYWSYGYRLEAVAQLEEILEQQMNREHFSKVKQPVLMLYYYKDQVHQDSVVKVDAMLNMFKELGTPDSLKHSVPMPLTGNHVIGSPIKSNDVAGVEREIESFLKNILRP